MFPVGTPGCGRVRSHCRFRYRATEYVRKSGVKWMSGGATRQRDRAPGRGRERRVSRRPDGPNWHSSGHGALAQRPGRAHGVDIGDAAGAHLVGGEVE